MSVGEGRGEGRRIPPEGHLHSWLTWCRITRSADVFRRIQPSGGAARQEATWQLFRSCVCSPGPTKAEAMDQLCSIRLSAPGRADRCSPDCVPRGAHWHVHQAWQAEVDQTILTQDLHHCWRFSSAPKRADCCNDKRKECNGPNCTNSANNRSPGGPHQGTLEGAQNGPHNGADHQFDHHPLAFPCLPAPALMRNWDQDTGMGANNDASEGVSIESSIGANVNIRLGTRVWIYECAVSHDSYDGEWAKDYYSLQLQLLLPPSLPLPLAVPISLP